LQLTVLKCYSHPKCLCCTNSRSLKWKTLTGWCKAPSSFAII
jgi:hypothetical protein